MLYDLSSILNNDGAFLEISEKIDLMQDGNNLGVAFEEPILVTGKIVCRRDVLELSAKVCGNFKTECARCLKEIELPLEFEFCETLAQSNENVTDDDSVILFEGKEIDLKDLVESNILLNLFSKYLCSEDCKGICSKCGADLNKGKCTCTDDEIDPRWEKLKNFKI